MLEMSRYRAGMNRQEIIAMLRKNEPTLRARGVSHAALFGPRARGDNRPDSDIEQWQPSGAADEARKALP
jgi:predicted nucleotidyltransferase